MSADRLDADHLDDAGDDRASVAMLTLQLRSVEREIAELEAIEATWDEDAAVADLQRRLDTLVDDRRRQYEQERADALAQSDAAAHDPSHARVRDLWAPPATDDRAETERPATSAIAGEVVATSAAGEQIAGLSELIDEVFDRLLIELPSVVEHQLAQAPPAELAGAHEAFADQVGAAVAKVTARGLAEMVVDEIERVRVERGELLAPPAASSATDVRVTIEPESLASAIALALETNGADAGRDTRGRSARRDRSPAKGDDRWHVDLLLALAALVIVIVIVIAWTA